MSEIPLLVDEARGSPGGGCPVLTVVLAHGAGAGMDSSFMNDVARGLSESCLRVVRFEFPYMRAARDSGRRTRPDAPSVLETTWMSVIRQLGDPSSLVIGGKSMGGRIASVVADRAAVRGLLCMGYPFHPVGVPGTLRVAHLRDLKTPALFLQGERDALGNRDEVRGYKLSPSIAVVFLEDGDHSFRPRKGSGRTYQQNLEAAVQEAAAFCRGLAPGGKPADAR